MAEHFSSTDIAAIAELVTKDAQKTDRLVVLIDGGSGAGKTTFARLLRNQLDCQLVSLDECYPGWHGLDAGAEMIPQMLTQKDPGFWRWDWVNSAPTTWQALDPKASIIVEGCGALRPTTAALATTTIWFEMDAELRKDRALSRDGDGFAPWWDMWAEQEHAHWREHRPWELANIIITEPAT